MSDTAALLNMQTSLNVSVSILRSGSLCIIQTDHLPLEELHAARLSGLPASEERQWQEEPATWVSQPTPICYYSFTNACR